MFVLYLISFVASIVGLFGAGHLFAGAPSKALSYFVAGVIWMFLAGLTGLASGGSLICCYLPMHLAFAHFCASDAVRIARGNDRI